MAEAAVETAPETGTKQSRKPGASKKKSNGRASDPLPKTSTFFEKLERIAKADWGTRAKIKTYRLEPVIDRLRGSAYKYIMVYEEPIDEERIKVDHGSGRYRLHLTFKAPQADEKELDSIEFDIMDERFPPKVNRGEWVDDPRNHKYAWIKKLWEEEDRNKAAQQNPTAGVKEMVDTVRAVQELTGKPESQGTFASQMVETIKAVRELTPQPTPSTDNALLNTVMQLMTTTMQQSQQTAQLQINAANEQVRELRAELRAMREQPAKNGFGSFKEILGEIKEFLPAIKEIVPGVSGVIQKSRMGAWQEFFTEALPHLTPIATPFAQAIGQMMLASAQMKMQEQQEKMREERAKKAASQPNAAPTPGTPAAELPAPATETNPANILMEFVNVHVNPALTQYLKQDYTGDALAESLYELYPNYKGVDWLTMMKTAGPDQVVQLYKTSPMWAQLELMEARFVEFVKEFCSFVPGEGEQSKPEASTDLDAMES
jgi:hypothetical protein